jgi:hypothetical protein
MERRHCRKKGVADGENSGSYKLAYLSDWIGQTDDFADH